MENCPDHVECVKQITQNVERISQLKESDTEQWEKIDKMEDSLKAILKRANHILLVLVVFLLGVVANFGYMFLKGG